MRKLWRIMLFLFVKRKFLKRLLSAAGALLQEAKEDFEYYRKASQDGKWTKEEMSKMVTELNETAQKLQEVFTAFQGVL